MRNFLQVASGVNYIPLLQQLYSNPHLWAEDRLRQEYAADSPHKEVEDILVRFSDTKDKKVGDALICEWTEASFLLPAAKNIALLVMSLMQGEILGRVMITRLSSGKTIQPHSDVLGAYAHFFTRYHVPLMSEPGVQFHCGDEYVNMQPGTVWWFNGHKEHAVVNNSAADRINLIVDCRIS